MGYVGVRLLEGVGALCSLAAISFARYFMLTVQPCSALRIQALLPHCCNCRLVLIYRCSGNCFWIPSVEAATNRGSKHHYIHAAVTISHDCIAPLLKLIHFVQTGTHAEHVAEAAARASEPARLPALMGAGTGLVDQTKAELDRAIEVLSCYLTDERISRMQNVLDQRTRSARVVFENPANPNNVSAL